MSAELEVLQDALARLEREGIAYMLTGSLALSYYAEPRMTRDIDLVVECAGRDPKRLAALFEPDYYVSEADVERALRERMRLAGFDAWIATREDLILSKLVWAEPSASELQLRDVRALLAGGADLGYLRRWAADLGVAYVLEKCLDERHDA